jgi:hypothetical protein
VTGKLRHIGENDMTRLLASLFIATSLLAVASSEASAWVCLAAGAGSSAYGRDYSHPDSWGIWSKSLHTLPGGGGNLAFRNLKRGVNLGLPSGQDVAKHMKIKNPLTRSEIASDSNGSTDGAIAKQQGLHTATPLWYYILKEAKVRHDGLRLGPVGSTIISEVFVGLVHGDHNSFLWQVKNWKPTLPSQTTGNFTMTDMLRFVNCPSSEILGQEAS